MKDCATLNLPSIPICMIIKFTVTGRDDRNVLLLDCNELIKLKYLKSNLDLYFCFYLRMEKQHNQLKASIPQSIKLNVLN